MKSNKISLQIEKQQAATKKRFNRRIKQYLILSAVSLPFLLWLGSFFSKIKFSYISTVLVYSAILITLWCFVLVLDYLISKRAKKLRQIKNAKLVIENYNAQVMQQKQNKVSIELNEIANVNVQKLEQKNNLKFKEENSNLKLNKINLLNENKNDIISDKEKSQKLKQKKYGNYKNKRKK